MVSRMENFINTTLDTTQLPKFEEVPFTRLHPKYLWIVMCGLSLFIIVIIGAPLGYDYFNPDEFTNRFWLLFGISVPIVVVLGTLFSVFSYKKKGYAFRTHDVLYRHGIIATTTIIIPYNRIQHVALHEGILARFFGLATIQIYTAGGSSSDLSIPGIAKSEAENIKQLLMGKIQKTL
jgi:membrane protein YdbS with pleckstrin-like domain